MGSNKAILHLENIRKSFGGLLVLSDIDLSVKSRKTAFLIPRKSESRNWPSTAFAGSTDESIQVKKYPF